VGSVTNVEQLPSPDDQQIASSKAAEYTLDLSVPLVNGAIVHHNAKGRADYWIVERPGEATRVRVIPYGFTRLGAAIHNINDGRDYILTPSGGWMGSE